MLDKTLGFIGFGNMGRAIAEGLLRAGALSADRMLAYAPHFEKLSAFCAPRGIHPCETLEELLNRADMLLMAVKPQVLPDVVQACGAALLYRPILSVVAGKALSDWQALCSSAVRVQYIMPNTPCQVCAGMSVFEQAHSLSSDERAFAFQLFESIGAVATVPGRLMGAAMALSGCGPAYAAIMAEALADAGVRQGLPRATAQTLAAQTLLGTAKLLAGTGIHPAALKDAVCSPGGTTIRGVEALEADGFRHALFDAVGASLSKG